MHKARGPVQVVHLPQKRMHTVAAVGVQYIASLNPLNQDSGAGGVAQVTEGLPSKCEALSSNPSMANTKPSQNQESPDSSCLSLR
jgi:hypothetical protein